MLPSSESNGRYSKLLFALTTTWNSSSSWAKAMRHRSQWKARDGRNCAKGGAFPTSLNGSLHCPAASPSKDSGRVCFSRWTVQMERKNEL